MRAVRSGDVAGIDAERAMAELRRRFRERARQRLARLGELVAALEGEGREAGGEGCVRAAAEARRLLHELAGGAGSFGFAALGARAAALEALAATDPARLAPALAAAVVEMRGELEGARVGVDRRRAPG